MKGHRLFSAAVPAVLLSFFVSCSGDKPATPEDAREPAVTVTAGTADETALSFTVTPENAVSCAWICLETGEEIPTAEEILRNHENAVSATEATYVEVTGLAPETEYVIAAAASDGKTAVLSGQVTMTTLETSAISFRNAIAEVYSGNSLITFTEESETYQLSLDFYYGTKAKWLPAGTYPVAGGDSAEGTVGNDPSYTMFRLLKEDKVLSISDGTVTVELDENNIYTITAEFNTGDGKFKTVFTGEISGYYFSYDFTATSARHIESDGGVPGEFYFILNDESRNYELVLDIFADAESAELPEGTYTAGSGNGPGTIGSKSCIDIFSPYSSLENFASGTVVVRKTGAVYVFDIKLANEDGFRINGTFTGEITEVNHVEREIVMESAGANLLGGWGDAREAVLRFFRGEDVLELSVLYNREAKYLPAGTYTARSSEEPWTIDTSNSDYTYFYYKEELYAVRSGTMTVAIADDLYDIEMDLSTSGGNVKFFYKGKIDGIDFFHDLSVLTDARRVKPDGEVPGEYCIKINDAPVRSQELTLDFFADAASDTLPEGTYTFGTGNAPGSLGTASVLNIVSPVKRSDEFASGTVEVTKAGEVYTFDIRLADADGYWYLGTFTGKITDMVREDVPDDMKLITFTRYKKGVCANDRNACFMLINDDNSICEINAYTDGSSFLPAGTYTVGEGTDAGTVQQGKWTSLTYYTNGKSANYLITDGKMTVDVNGGSYTITFDFTAADGNKYRAKYQGEFTLTH